MSELELKGKQELSPAQAAESASRSPMFWQKPGPLSMPSAVPAPLRRALEPVLPA